MSFRLTWRIHVVILAITVFVVLVFYNYINNVIYNFLIKPFMCYPFQNLIINFYIYYIMLGVLVTIFHEALHGAAYKFFGGKVKFGFKVIFAYTMEISGKAIMRNKFLIVLLTPLVIITLVSLILPDWLGNMIFIINSLGSLGDILMALYLCKFNKNTKIVDKSYGFDVI
jgi:hypothetical protein